MSFMFRWTFRLTVLLLSLSVLAFSLAYYLAAQSLPRYNKDIQFQELNSNLEIIRDTYNVPHIFGQNDEDVFLDSATAMLRIGSGKWQLYAGGRKGVFLKSLV